jgi:flavodoxin
MKSIVIVYGTSNRDIYTLCKKVSHELERRDSLVAVQSCEITIEREIDFCDCIIFAAQSYGTGELDIMMSKFFETLKKLDLQDKPSAIIALGDSRYNVKGSFASEVECLDFFEKHNGSVIMNPLVIMKNTVISSDDMIEEWGDDLIQRLKEEMAR